MRWHAGYHARAPPSERPGSTATGAVPITIGSAAFPSWMEPRISPAGDPMITRMLRDLLWLGSFLALVGFGFVVVRRIVHPTPPDPVESLILEHASRLAARQPFYVEPAATPAPFLMPGF